MKDNTAEVAQLGHLHTSLKVNQTTLVNLIYVSFAPNSLIPAFRLAVVTSARRLSLGSILAAAHTCLLS